ncbi:scavenger mRNA-decapping enzyme DcpS, putative [Entamoeba dispar SAW760]|uniref:Scavenger mRNA-decapping enzyme DcpS, putative n=1 Tax=Entamoeba dispar (strain ATCC PRA-260 / SAW760) TaxID=370354 RepID=B0EET7_ENTDS|nr:scavenger mRNA-decapping enzyme DcpS, putative [Entamoeba dispar SAW760]EDR26970.1 scavenger mRNA-decapping enzyme DcpS, putative [Entamoeba dispar SAW760]|eukprot:EDR26970.1 scavenger mRNA-decapping enzyme DcpS, putative [Entamoeba dispar SAW760]
MTENIVVLNDLKDSKGITLLKDEKSIFCIIKSQIGIDEANKLIQLIKKEPSKDIVTQTVSSIKYNKLIKLDKQQTSYEINVMKPQNIQEINKYKKQQYKLFLETPELYQQYTLPYISTIPSSTLQWINDYSNDITKPLLKGNGFFLVPDVKWNMKDMNLFYGICFSNDPSILSIRSLRQCHLPLLKRMRFEVLKYINSVTSLKEEEIVIYCHYHPSFWHFHVHFTSINFPTLARNNSIGKAILLDTIIQNIELDDLYYSKANIIISIGTAHQLYDKFNQTK